MTTLAHTFTTAFVTAFAFADAFKANRTKAYRTELMRVRPSFDKLVPNVVGTAASAGLLAAAGLSATRKNGRRVVVGDEDYAIRQSDEIVVLSSYLTEPRTWTLPSASRANDVYLVNRSRDISLGAPLTIHSTSGDVVIDKPFDVLHFTSNGTQWKPAPVTSPITTWLALLGVAAAGLIAGALYVRQVTSELRDYMGVLADKCKEYVPVESGVLQGTIKFALRSPNTLQAQGALYAGNKARREVVVRANLFGRRGFGPKDPDGVLAFMGDNGETVFTKHVGAAEANDWLQRAWDDTSAERAAMVERIGSVEADRIEASDIMLDNQPNIDGYNPDEWDFVDNTAANRALGGQTT